MFAEQRIKEIKKIMKKKKQVDINTLSSELNVSDVTVRKDLNKLAEMGFLKKKHGGAILVENENENINLNIENKKEKEYLIELAYDMIDEGDTIFLGSGTTCYLLAKKLKEKKDITVLTNNISALEYLVPHIKNVFLIGGEVVYYNGMVHSSGRKDGYFHEIFANKAFTSVTGVDKMSGLTVNRAVSCYIYDKISKISKEWFLMVDDSKFDKVGLYQVGLIEDPDYLITNKIKEEYEHVFKENKVKIIN